MRFRSFVLASVLLVPIPAFAEETAPAPPPPPLAPPPPMSSPPAPADGPSGGETTAQQTTEKLDESEKKDSGRGFELFYLDGSIGGSYINLEQFSSSSFGIQKSSAGGPAFSLGAGVRLLVFIAGVRARYNALSSFNMWQLNGEAGLKLPIGPLDILFDLHGGYSFVGRLGDAAAATDTSVPDASDKVSIRGFNGGLEFGLDYYVSPVFSVGVGALADVLFLKRPPVPIPAGLTPQAQDAIKTDPLYQNSGSSAGFQLAGGLRLGLHFGL